MFMTKTTGNILCYIRKIEYYSATKKEQNDDTSDDMEELPKHHVDQESADCTLPSTGSSKTDKSSVSEWKL